MDNTAARAFSARIAYWTSQGLSGLDLYERMAADDELPAVFDTDDLAAIQGISPLSVKKARHRGAGPNFMRLSARAVRYSRPDLCAYLASKYVKVREAA
ncbi:helix-turn-helix transcriptional regulator [Mesorhizobium calcicola]|uniref:Helix-turn-helix transcriptional regulator n=1 Tax=Mesorhizobium calcicola TaxID=1300310 RepID=A0ABW4WBE8_9HYPH